MKTLIVDDGLVFGAWVIRPWHGGWLSGPAHVQVGYYKTLCNRKIRSHWNLQIITIEQIGCRVCRQRLEKAGKDETG